MAQTIYALLLEQCNAVLKQAQERIIFSTVWAQLILVIKCILWPTKFFGHTVFKSRRKLKKKKESKLGSFSILIKIKQPAPNQQKSQIRFNTNGSLRDLHTKAL